MIRRHLAEWTRRGLRPAAVRLALLGAEEPPRLPAALGKSEVRAA